MTSQSPISSKQILIIEDNNLLNKTIQKVLERNNYIPIVAHSGAEGLQKALSCHPHLILCDIKLNDLSGYKILSILKETPSTASIPFIFLSGLSEYKDVRLGMELGADDYLTKPFDPNDLIISIKRRLERFDAIKGNQEDEFEKFFIHSPTPMAVFQNEQIVKTNIAFNDLMKTSSIEASEFDLDRFILTSTDEFKSKLRLCREGVVEQIKLPTTLNTTDNQEIKVTVNMCQSKLFHFNAYVVCWFVPTVKCESSSGLFDFIDKLSKIIEPYKNQLPQELIEQVKKACIGHSDKKHQQDESNLKLSLREHEILKLTCEGKPMKLIADTLSISIKTVEKHRGALLKKTGTKNAANLVIYAIHNNLID